MPYMPKRIYEDESDIFTPFVPMDSNNQVEDCSIHFKVKQSTKKQHFVILIIIIMLLYIMYRKSLK